MAEGTRRRRRWPWVLVVLALVVGAVWWLAWAAAPLVGLPDTAAKARAELSRAQAAVEAGRVRVARRHVRAARGHVDEARDLTGGTARTVLSWVPLVGSAVSDGRHLVSALDHATAVAEGGLEVYPSLTGRGAKPLFSGDGYDPDVLDDVVGGAREVGEAALAAERDLEQVEASAPIVGDRIAAARDAAAERVVPLAEGYRRARPIVEQLPAALGAEEPVTYLVGLMNNGEMRFSGGSPQAFTTVTVHDGRIEFGDSVDLSDFAAGNRRLKYDFEHVPGNPFTTRRFPNVTEHPDWSVSGVELMRAWEAASDRPVDATVVLDVPAMAQFLRLTGPVEVPGYGRVTGRNLVRIQATSYDTVTDPMVRKALNDGLVEAVQGRLLDGGEMLEKGRLLLSLAEARHLAIVAEEPELDRAFVAAGLGGRLTDAAHDYLGVFSMSRLGSKADYYQHRRLTSHVSLRADGSARVRTEVRLETKAPPYAGPDEDPRYGYQTRWAHPRLLQVLPAGAEVTDAGSTRKVVDGDPATFDGRPWALTELSLPPDEPRTTSLEYDVPRAAEASEDRLVYRLAYDPQGLVHMQHVRVRLTPPEGWEVASAPAGWTAEGGGYVLDAGQLRRSEAWRLVLEPS